MQKELLHVKVKIDAIFHCPHAPEENCECRKPKSGMFKEAIKAFDIDVTQSWMIGDKPSDIEAAKCAGIERTILIGKTSVNFILDTIDLIKE